MSGQSRTFALQAVAVAVVVGIVFFAFLRPSDVGELAGIDARRGEEPFARPGDDERHRDVKASKRSDESNQPQNSMTLVRNGFAPGGASGAASSGEDPAGDQYVTTAAEVMSRVREFSAKVEP